MPKSFKSSVESTAIAVLSLFKFLESEFGGDSAYRRARRERAEAVVTSGFFSVAIENTPLLWHGGRRVGRSNGQVGIGWARRTTCRRCGGAASLWIKCRLDGSCSTRQIFGQRGPRAHPNGDIYAPPRVTLQLAQHGPHSGQLFEEIDPPPSIIAAPMDIDAPMDTAEGPAAGVRQRDEADAPLDRGQQLLFWGSKARRAC
eukprot:3984419-Amphidinium_carterae.1